MGLIGDAHGGERRRNCLDGTQHCPVQTCQCDIQGALAPTRKVHRYCDTLPFLCPSQCDNGLGHSISSHANSDWVAFAPKAKEHISFCFWLVTSSPRQKER